MLRLEVLVGEGNCLRPTVLRVVLEPDHDLRGMAPRRAAVRGRCRDGEHGGEQRCRQVTNPHLASRSSRKPRRLPDWFRPPPTAAEIGIDHYPCQEGEKCAGCGVVVLTK